MTSIVPGYPLSVQSPSLSISQESTGLQGQDSNNTNALFSGGDEVVISPEAQAAFQDDPNAPKPGGHPPSPPDPEPPGT